MPTNSLSTDWDKFYTMVMGEDPSRKKDPGYTPPSEQPKRVTGEGLNVYERQTVAVDPFTGNPITAGPSPAQMNANDIIENRPVQVAAPPRYSTLDTIEPLDQKYLALSTSPFAKAETSAEKAIAAATAPRVGLTFMDQVAARAGTPRRAPAPMPDMAYDDPAVQAWLNDQTILGPAPATAAALGARQPIAATPARSQVAQAMAARPITYDQPRVNVPGTAGSVNGVDMAFMPVSVQTSSRWRTGY